jgi:Na+-transporting NADH:ubiquinone oxidoreductase subunit NqrB
MALGLKVQNISYCGKVEHQNLDPRYYQIGVLAALLVYGLIRLDFEVTPIQILLILTTALWTQLFCTRAWKLPFYDPRSSLISGLSLCLLMRTDSLWLAVVSTAVAILSKFVLRVGTKHLFNPTNFGLICMVGLTDRVWVSPGQWGNDAIFAFFMACLGGFVVNRALRSGVSLVFLGSYAALLVSRSLWLGEPCRFLCTTCTMEHSCYSASS